MLFAIDNCILSHDICDQPSDLYYITLRNFIDQIAELTEKIKDYDYFLSLKLTLQAISLSTILLKSNLSVSSEHLTKLYSQLLQYTYNFIFSIDESYERALPENLETIFEALEKFENINVTLLSDMAKFNFTSIKMESEKLKMGCTDLLSIKLLSLQNDIRFDFCFSKSAPNNEKELFVKNRAIMKKFQSKNVLSTVKNAMSIWVKSQPEKDLVLENEIIEDADNILRLDKLLSAGEPVERPRRYSI
jgi:hypothetical protein